MNSSLAMIKIIKFNVSCNNMSFTRNSAPKLIYIDIGRQRTGKEHHNRDIL